MEFQKSEKDIRIHLTQQDIGLVAINGITGDREGVFGMDSKVTVRTPYDDERLYIRHTPIYVFTDRGFDLTVVLNPYDRLASGYVHEVPRDALLAASYVADPDGVIPEQGLLIHIDPPALPEQSNEAIYPGLQLVTRDYSIWARVIDADTNTVERLYDRTFTGPLPE